MQVLDFVGMMFMCVSMRVAQRPIVHGITVFQPRLDSLRKGYNIGHCIYSREPVMGNTGPGVDGVVDKKRQVKVLGYTDADLSSRFASSDGKSEQLMDEATVRKLMAAEKSRVLGSREKNEKGVKTGKEKEQRPQKESKEKEPKSRSRRVRRSSSSTRSRRKRRRSSSSSRRRSSSSQSRARRRKDRKAKEQKEKEQNPEKKRIKKKTEKQKVKRRKTRMRTLEWHLCFELDSVFRDLSF